MDGRKKKTSGLGKPKSTQTEASFWLSESQIPSKSEDRLLGDELEAVIGFVAVFADVQTFVFFFGRDAEADRGLDDEPGNRRDDQHVGATGDDARQLRRSAAPRRRRRTSPRLAPAMPLRSVSSANRPTQSVPNTPLSKWTEVAPTGSSARILSKNRHAEHDEHAADGADDEPSAAPRQKHTGR